jgi:hypothetical protein
MKNAWNRKEFLRKNTNTNVLYIIPESFTKFETLFLGFLR